MIRSLVTALSLLLACCSLSQTKELVFEQYTVKQGLANNRINTVFEDSLGFVWVGTIDGLNRFDGYEFRTWKLEGDDSTSLSHNDVKSIFEDSRGTLWVGTAFGLNKFSRETESFVRYMYHPTREGALRHGTIMDIDEDRNGNLWLATYGGGLGKFDPDSEFFTMYSFSEANSEKSILQDFTTSVHVGIDGLIWIGLNGYGLDRFDPIKEVFSHHTFGPVGVYGDTRNDIRSISQGEGDQLWIASIGGLNVFSQAESRYLKQYRNDPLDNTTISSDSIVEISKDNDGKVWLATVAGYSKLDPLSGKVTHRNKANLTPDVPASSQLTAIFDNGKGTIWIGTMSDGLLKSDYVKKAFKITLSAVLDGNTEQKLDVYDVIEDNKQRVGLATNVGFLTSDHDNLNIDGSFEPFAPPRFTGIVLSTYQDTDNVYWIGRNDGLDRFDSDENQTTRYRYRRDDPGTIGYGPVSAIVEDHMQNLWIGTEGGGLSRFDKETGTFQVYKFNGWDGSGISNLTVLSMIIDSRKNLWVGTRRGLNKYDFNSGAFSYLLEGEIGEVGLSQLHIYCIFEDSKGNLWVGTKGGVDKIDYEGIKLANYNVEDGLPSNLIYGILEDKQGFIWLSTGLGISRLDPQTGQFRNYDDLDGLPQKSFFHSSTLRDSQGRLHFGGRGGLVSFFPEQLKDNDVVPNIVITDFSILNESALDGNYTKRFQRPSPLKKSMGSTEHITLGPDENVFSLQFSALSHVANRKNLYAYKLEGFDNDWIFSGGRRTATYTNLDPGDYLFRVKGSNNDGIWNEEGAFLNITVLPPWWKTWWAYSIYGFLIVSLILYFRQNLIRQERLNASLALEKLEIEKMKELDDLKTRFFTNISHDLRTPLTLILGPLSELLKKNQGSASEVKLLQMMYQNGQTLLRLINQLLDVTKISGNKLTLAASKGDLLQLIRQVFNSFESAATQKSIIWQLDARNPVADLYFDPDKMEKILSNLLSNALKFTAHGGKVVLSVQKEDVDYISIRIEDTGIGIASDEVDLIFERFYQSNDQHENNYLGTGIGLSLVKELVELHHGTIDVVSELGKGSTFRVLLPLGSDHLESHEIFDHQHATDNALPAQPGLSETIDYEYMEESSDPMLLVVEDNLDMRLYIRGSLENEYEIIEAQDGSIGLELACERIPDLIISDVMMPKMSGLEFCEQLKSNEKTSHIPVILLTARATQENMIEGLESGADAYLTKPFSTDELSVRVRKLIEQRAALRAKFSKQIHLRPADVTVTSVDEKFLSRAIKIIEDHISDSEFDVPAFGREIGLSRVQLYRKLKALSNLSVTEFIRNIRLKRAAQLMDQDDSTVAEISYKVGFSDHSYFSKRFKELFGSTPTEYVEERKKSQM